MLVFVTTLENYFTISCAHTIQSCMYIYIHLYLQMRDRSASRNYAVSLSQYTIGNRLYRGKHKVNFPSYTLNKWES